MKKSKKIAVIVLAIFIVLTASYIIVPGFIKQGNVYIADYSVSKDRTEITITVGVSTSIGYVRKISEYQQYGGKLYLDCYSAFGGINGSWGAKNEYTIHINEDTEMISLYRSANCYEPILEKDANGEWQQVTQ